MALKYIKGKIAGIRKFIRILLTLEGSFKTILTLSVTILLSFVLDYFLHFPLKVRTVMLGIYLCAIVYVIARHLVLPLTRKISDEDIALAVEKQNPQLKDRLISALQFSRLLDDPQYHDSRDMTLNVIEETEKLSKGINFFRVLNFSRTLRSMVLPIVFAAAVFSLYNQFPKLSGIWLNRNVLLKQNAWPRSTTVFLVRNEFTVYDDRSTEVNVAWENSGSSKGILWYKSSNFWKRAVLNPTEKGYKATLPQLSKNTIFYTEIDDIVSSAYRLRVTKGEVKENKEKKPNEVGITLPDTKLVMSKGERLSLKIYASGKIPSGIEVYFRNKGVEDQSWNSELAGHQGEGIFKYTFPPMIDDIEFYLEGNDDVDGLPVYNVEVLNPPTITKSYMWYEYPAYSGLASTEKDKPEQHGNVKALQGTTVRLLFTTNIPIAEANVLFPDDQQEVYPNTKLDILKDGKLLATSFEVKMDSRYRITLRAKNGLRNTSPTSYYVRMMRDSKPYVKGVFTSSATKGAVVVSGVKPRIYMLRTATVPLRVDVEDDYGISNIAILRKANKEDTWKRQPLEILTEEEEEQQQKKRKGKRAHSYHIFSLEKGTVVDEGSTNARKLQKGDVVYYKLYAQDNNNISGPGTKESDVYSIEIVDDTQLLKKLNERLLENKRQLGRILDLQLTQKEKIDDFLSISSAVETGDLVKIHQWHFAQKNISRQVHDIAQAVRYVMWTAGHNSIWDVFTTKKVQDVHRLLLDIASPSSSTSFTGKSNEAATNIIDAYKTILNDADKGQSKLRDAVFSQEEIVTLLEEVIDLLGQWEDLRVEDDIKRLLEESKKQQQILKSWTE
ncbi:hypothetical protein [Candidatus Uabimicrobium amorphum]|uniref:Polyketide synthase n=1 Tax=Uabimicrobium amorphum TaxID=2596890 RepID=A0A5S9IIU7_UABAM|nr:hypothetical protein [Candidatus Uabimicrobium amorphum]BBM82256.1 polyketide synthase [Candidatus Uabimicrobium amorphum]